jgi:hypothetical protein
LKNRNKTGFYLQYKLFHRPASNTRKTCHCHGSGTAVSVEFMASGWYGDGCRLATFPPAFAFKVIGARKRANSSPAVCCFLENREADVHAVARKWCRGGPG